ncbi:hypothetical protein AVEN_133476-1 [Araneus ventricosus]|uniref:Uncharacterized protein n=1 Tax=Araneus ventricosus TaxID=182803 RepID=A0A4Y2KD13_ARAVE|nr:hypothetical protein AVEN_133476-1 [Araneus ventricosus]
MNPNEERRRSELQNTLPLRNPFTAQTLRKEKATLSTFTLDGLLAPSQHSSGWHGVNPKEKDISFQYILLFLSFPHKVESHCLFMGFGLDLCCVNRNTSVD